LIFATASFALLTASFISAISESFESTSFDEFSASAVSLRFSSLSLNTSLSIRLIFSLTKSLFWLSEERLILSSSLFLSSSVSLISSSSSNADRSLTVCSSSAF